MCSKSTTKGPGWHRSGRSTANFKRAQHINIVFSFLTSNKKLAAEIHKGVAAFFWAIFSAYFEYAFCPQKRYWFN